MPLTGRLVAAYRRLLGVEPLDDAEDWQAEVEMFAAYFLVIGFGTIVGLSIIEIPPGPVFSVAWALACGALGFICGTAIPLQLVAWRRLRGAALQRAGWRWVTPLTVAFGAFTAGLAIEFL